MLEYKKGNLLIISDFEIRTLMEDSLDMDLIIPIDFRTLNLHMEDIPDYIDSRIQLTEVRNIIIRFSTKKDNDYCTIYFLRSVDLQSAVMNFVMSYKDHYIKLERRKYSGEMYILSKESIS